MHIEIPRKHIVQRRVPKQKRSKDKVKRILDSAEQLMAELGPENISTHQVAASAGIAVGSLYQFFPNIDTVKIALVERAMNLLYDKTVNVLKSAITTDIADISILLIDATLDFYYQRQDVVRSILISRNTEAFQSVNNNVNERLVTAILDFISEKHLDKSKAELERKIRISILLGDVMTMLVWTAENEKEREAYIAEWKLLTYRYTKTISD